MAWLARSDADDQGVVITNGAGAIAHDVGVRFGAKKERQSDLVLWEAHVPPGEWKGVEKTLSERGATAPSSPPSPTTDADNRIAAHDGVR